MSRLVKESGGRKSRRVIEMRSERVNERKSKRVKEWGIGGRREIKWREEERRKDMVKKRRKVVEGGE